MSTFSRVLLSASTNGRPVKVAATATPGTTIHTAVSGTSSWDEIWLWAFNSDTTTRKLTIEWGGTTSPDDTVEQYLPPETGGAIVITGWNLNNGLIVKAFADSANVVMLAGYVNRIT